MTEVWKFAIDAPGRQRIEMPRGAEALTVQIQKDKMVLWARVDPDEPRVARDFVIVGTEQGVLGHAGRYIGTVQERRTGLVWHCFEA